MRVPAALALHSRRMDDLVTMPFRARRDLATLYHYTDAKGFEGIVSSASFWATDCTKARGGARDLTIAPPVILRVVQAIAAKQHGTVRSTCEAFLRQFDDQRLDRKTKVFVTSFSPADDMPSQWNTYGFGGTGVCVGVRRLDEAPRELLKGLGCLELDVEYDLACLERRVDEAMGAIIGEARWFASAHRGLAADAAQVLWSAMFRLAAYAMMASKHSEAATEQERRLVCITSSEAPKPESNGATEYFAIPARANRALVVFDSVTVGPAAAPGMENRVRETLVAAGYAGDGKPAVPSIRRESASTAPAMR